MPEVRATSINTVTEKGLHQGHAAGPNVCILPANGSPVPIPIPYPNLPASEPPNTDPVQQQKLRSKLQMLHAQLALSGKLGPERTSLLLSSYVNTLLQLHKP
jgi:hypothetical protein